MQSHENSTPSRPEEQKTTPSAPKPKRHLIKSAWIRRPLKVLGVLIVLILIIPVLLYLPPVQDFAVKTATKMVEEKTGMKIGVDKLRLKFPIDLSLSGVSVIEASGDTMALAREAIVDIKLLPLTKLDVQINRLSLLDGYYRMLSSDSSMLMTIKAGLLEVDDKSSFDLKSSSLIINNAKLKDGTVNLSMDVWRQTPSQDSTSAPFYIKANTLDIENILFTMSMLPTIDTLRFQTDRLSLSDGVIDLGKNDIRIGTVSAVKGEALMLAPSAQYVQEHPAPAPDTTAVQSPPMIISVKDISLSDFNARYAVKDAPAVKGFNTNDIRFSNLSIGLENFLNKGTEISLPITNLQGMEQCGLTIAQGSGVFSMDSVGMYLKDLDIRTPFSHIEATAAIPTALLEFMPSALLDVDVDASLGMTDINNFMPDLKTYTSAVPSTTPLNAKIKVNGTLNDADISRLDVALPGTLSIKANGKAKNALDFNNLIANIKLTGSLSRPSVIDKFVKLNGVNIPTLSIDGSATANRQNYGLDFRLTTHHGNLAALGHVGMNSERYDVKASTKSLNVGAFIGDKSIGPVTASISASGAGFNPEKKGANTDIRLDLDNAIVNGHSIDDITLLATLRDEYFTLKANSANPLLSFDIAGNGRISDDYYEGDVVADIRNADLYALGFSESANNGRATIHLSGNASPHTWLYDVNLHAQDVDWNLPDQNISVPEGVDLKLLATSDNTHLLLDARGASLDFMSSVGLQPVINSFTKVADMLPQAIKDKRVDVEQLEANLPPFTLKANVVGNGVANQFLEESVLGFGDLSLNLAKDSIINGNAVINALSTKSMRLDTITFNLNQRGNLLDYVLHLGNRPGTFDEFADVRVSGYMGDNRLSAYLVQHNIKKKMGYRLGFTASMADSVVSLRFTPLKATIAYLPWTFNLDNYIDFTLTNKKVDANLMASSAESSILLRTEPSTDGYDNLHLNLKNIRVEDFLQMALNPPPVRANVNSDINVRYTGRAFVGKGSLDINDFFFDRKRVGDFNLTLAAGMGKQGKSAGKIGLLVDNKEAAALQFVLAPDSTDADKGLMAERLNLVLTQFPLAVANPFFPKNTMKLSGALNGNMSMTGKFSAPKLNGSISCDSVAAFVNMLGTTFRFDRDPITVQDNVLDFHEFDILAVNKNPLTIRGTVDANRLNDMKFDLTAKAANIQLVGGKKSNADITGKLFLDLDAKVKGSMSLMNVDASVNVLPTTDVTYNMVMGSDALSAQQGADGVVRFVNFADTTKVAQSDSLKSSLAMRITAKAIISQGAQVMVNLGDDGKVLCNPSGTLNYFQDFAGDMRLNGTLYTGEGYANYKIMLLGKKNFNFNQNSHITWNGDILNPTLNITATDPVKTNISMNGNARLVNFIVSLNITNTLSAPSVVFDLSTDDDMSIANELQSMTADQRMQQAVSLLLTGTYSGPGAKTVNSNLVTSNLYSMLTSQLNAFAANTIKGVDINFGVDQYQTGTNGNTSTNTSYSYQVSKSLINNRFKIIVGGNYSTDASADENFEQNLISDIAFEYILKQTNNMSLNARLFRHTGFESVLEGEITETGVGISLRRRLAYFTEITHFGLSKLWKKKKISTDEAALDSIIDNSIENKTIGYDSINATVRKEDDDAK